MILRRVFEFTVFLAIFLSAFVLYQLPEAPTKFIYFNF